MNAPSSLPELVDAVRAMPQLLPVGAGTKPRLSVVDVPKLSLTGLRGIVEYDPSEFTFTARAGTPLSEIIAALAERGQYLPFDPLLVDAGATLGGTVASGLSGPGRFRFGGVRDFILGVYFVDGSGRLLHMGGKVVKNAAGFDLPKFFVGSLGRFGVLGEITFKVFPQPVSTLTLRLTTEGMAATAKLINALGNTRWEPNAIDVPPEGDAVYVRLPGPAKALQVLAAEMLARFPGEILSDDAATEFWSGLREFTWAYANGPLIKIALTSAVLLALEEKLQSLADARMHISSGGNQLFLSLPSARGTGDLTGRLGALGVSAMTLRGETPLWLGVRSRTQIAKAVKEALDPQARFPSLDD